MSEQQKIFAGTKIKKLSQWRSQNDEKVTHIKRRLLD